ncbi:MAG: hypothetical protein EOO50_14870 [Flavobacterium sp.]|uniref:hypothetical protein n=1 Tax=Flavobacterium sp. TaxID=239 RepID=UPI00121512E6|nr:hypothetical protein [Flavobacterium sp.]RZJ65121.1 MAG: hypothetical protein EOO50_14870 [Flavobacterium sp.]
MKIRLLTTILLLTGFFASAQMGGMNSGVRNRNMMQQPQSDDKPKGPSPDEQLDKFMVQVVSDLELNGLQEAAIRNIYKDQMKQMEAIRSSTTMTESDKQEEARLLSEKTDKEVKALLDAPQLEKYENMKKDLRSGKKKKKKKKDEEDKEPHE